MFVDTANSSFIFLLALMRSFAGINREIKEVLPKPLAWFSSFICNLSRYCWIEFWIDVIFAPLYDNIIMAINCLETCLETPTWHKGGSEPSQLDESCVSIWHPMQSSLQHGAWQSSNSVTRAPDEAYLTNLIFLLLRSNNVLFIYVLNFSSARGRISLKAETFQSLAR